MRIVNVMATHRPPVLLELVEGDTLLKKKGKKKKVHILYVV